MNTLKTSAPSSAVATVACTCQICGRAIKLNKNGKISHHGYKRPGWGSQTASCPGTKKLPYELSCDAISGAIKGAEDFIAKVETIIADVDANPPATITYFRTGAYRATVVERPEGFDAASVKFHGGLYLAVLKNEQYARRNSIKAARTHIEVMQKRLAAWKAPVAAE